jgi:thiol-disulfide isomerase/thioredoxin
MGLIHRNRSGLLGMVMLVGLAVAGCGGPAGDLTDAAASAPADSGSDENFAPEFTLTDIDGNEVSLASTAGKVRLIDFWATWCPPCRDEIPMLNELSEAYRDQGFEILAISDENQKVISKFAEEYEVKYTNLVGTERVSEQYIVLGLPAAYLIDGEGRIVESFLGPKPRKVLEAKIRELLELPPST